MEKYYVYKIIDPITQEYYIGSRGCWGNAEDDAYMGSYISWKPQDKSRLIKKILKSDFRYRKEAYNYEGQILQSCINDPLNKNNNVARLDTKPLVLKSSTCKSFTISKT